MADPKRLQAIVDKHMDNLSRELAREFTRPVFESLGLADVPSKASPVPPTSIETETLPLYDARTRRWLCAKCRQYGDPRRRAVTTHMRFCTTPPPAPPRRKARKKKP